MPKTLGTGTTTGLEIFVDLDRVLADFSKGMEKILHYAYGKPEKHSEESYDNNEFYKHRMWYAVDVYHNSGGELWYDLELMEDALHLWHYIKRYDPQILSATGPERGLNAEDQKRRWVAEKLGPDVIVNLTEHAAEKALYAAPDRILIDDKTKAINPWIAKSGIGIVHTSAEDTISQLQELGI